jgi:hypothetical protein
MMSERKCTSAEVALLMREKVCEFYFNLGSVFVYQMFKNVRFKITWIVVYLAYC